MIKFVHSTDHIRSQMTSLIHKNILISGKVQGVYYRATAKHVADKLGIKGIVLNKPDGTVYVEVEGLPSEVDHFIAWCRTGPPAAAVKNTTVAPGPMKDFPDFRIIR